MIAGAMLAFSLSLEPIIPSPAWADLYTWVDDRGVHNIVDNPTLIPERFRRQARLFMTSSASRGTESMRAAIVPPSREDSPLPPAVSRPVRSVEPPPPRPRGASPSRWPRGWPWRIARARSRRPTLCSSGGFSPRQAGCSTSRSILGGWPISRAHSWQPARRGGFFRPPRPPYGPLRGWRQREASPWWRSSHPCLPSPR